MSEIGCNYAVTDKILLLDCVLVAVFCCWRIKLPVRQQYRYKKQVFISLLSLHVSVSHSGCIWPVAAQKEIRNYRCEIDVAWSEYMLW